MKLFFLGLVVIVSFGASAQELDDYIWKNRLVLIVSSDLNKDNPKKQMDLLRKERKALEERDMLVLPLTTDTHQLNRYQLPKDFEGILLIGKDGGLKFQDNFITKPSILFTLVDGMPMRKAEIRRKKGR